jgi:hypothetical protein
MIRMSFAIVVYLLALLVNNWINRREFSRSPEKGNRYALLPIRYKFLCWFAVLPLFASVVFHPAFFIPAVLAFAFTEGLCVRWYRRAGLFTP